MGTVRGVDSHAPADRRRHYYSMRSFVVFWCRATWASPAAEVPSPLERESLSCTIVQGFLRFRGHSDLGVFGFTRFTGQSLESYRV